jgi:hypothetical protein
MLSALAMTATGAVTLLGLLHLILYWIHDINEPPIASTPIPFLGHIFGLITKKTDYYVRLRLVFKLIRNQS